jgi:hypothetical protein
MQRRELIKGVAAGGLASVAVGTASASHTTHKFSTAPSELDAINVVRDGETVESVENPTKADLDALRTSLSPRESLVTPQECCFYECSSDCAYCEYGCCGYEEEC